MKKNYMKPVMTVVPLRHRMTLLTGSQVRSMRSNLAEEEAIDYVGAGTEEAR